MDLASSLIRSVVRAFYANEYILIIDALMVHSTLRDDDLAYLMGMQAKYLRKLCGKLKEDGILSVHSRPELRQGAQRPFNRDYYFINFHRAIDVIKYRVAKITREVKEKFTQSAEEQKQYRCPQCKSEYTLMEVLDGAVMSGFECRACGHLLEYLETDGQAGSGNEMLKKLNEQLSVFEELMRQIDNTSVPENDFETANANSRPVQRNKDLNPITASEVVVGRDGSRYPPSSVKGLKTEAEKIQISLVDDSQAAKKLDAAAESEKRAKTAAQNALPAWHVNSTVTGEPVAVRSLETTQEKGNTNGATARADDDDEKKVEDTTTLNSYFAALKEEQAREREVEVQEEADEEEEEADDEGDADEADAGFEDVTIENIDPRSVKRVRIQEPGENGDLPDSGTIAQNSTKEIQQEVDSDEDDFEDVM